MNPLKRFFKSNSHNPVLKPLAGLGRSVNRLYENRNHDLQSNGELNVLKKLSRFNPTTIFDVGANIGDYATLAIENCKQARIYCFEPVSNTFAMLQENLKGNSTERVQLTKAGFYKERKNLLINIYPGHAHASLHPVRGINYNVEGQEEIELITGDDFIHSHQLSKIDLIKLDIEGSEMDALLGLNRAFSEKKVRMVQFEYGYINITTKNLLADYYDFFKSHGYIVGKIYPKKVEFRDYSFHHEDFIGPNYLAVHQSDTNLIKALS